jgi:hypothetical protein
LKLTDTSARWIETPLEITPGHFSHERSQYADFVRYSVEFVSFHIESSII